MRSFKAVCMIQAIQVADCLFLVDCLKVGYPNVLADRRLLKITSEVTETGYQFEKVIEVNCKLTCQESLATGLDLRLRPIKDLIPKIKEDFENIKLSFAAQSQSQSIKDQCHPKRENYNTQTVLGRLLKLRADIARSNDEGVQFIMED